MGIRVLIQKRRSRGRVLRRTDEAGEGGGPHRPHSYRTQSWRLDGMKDLGVSDSTTIWFSQTLGREERIIDSIQTAASEAGLYAKVLRTGLRLHQALFPALRGDHGPVDRCNARRTASRAWASGQPSSPAIGDGQDQHVSQHPLTGAGLISDAKRGLESLYGRRGR